MTTDSWRIDVRLRTARPMGCMLAVSGECADSRVLSTLADMDEDLVVGAGVRGRLRPRALFPLEPIFAASLRRELSYSDDVPRSGVIVGQRLQIAPLNPETLRRRAQPVEPLQPRQPGYYGPHRASAMVRVRALSRPSLAILDQLIQLEGMADGVHDSVLQHRVDTVARLPSRWVLGSL